MLLSTSVEASAPAITATFNQLGSSLQQKPETAYEGALYWNAYNKYIAGGNNDYAFNGGFDASRSSSIYGAGTTIRPISKSTIFLIRY